MIEKLSLLEDVVPAVPPYKFKEFNRVQSTILLNGLPTEDCNLVLGTATSTGKTIAAELFIYAIFPTKKRILYVAPMKALVREKLEEWTEHFPNKKVTILTGDYRPTTATKDKLREADIVVVTSEMLDSQTRGAIRSDNHWLSNIGLIIMDEAHIIGSNSRGPAAEAGITRLCSVDAVDPPRIVLLSATLPNSEEFANWLYKLNGKKTYSLNSKWRPVPLKWEFYPCNEKWYAAQRNFLIKNCVNMVRKDKESKYLLFVHEKKTGHNLVKALAKVGIQTDFHRADLNMKRRVDLENQFKDPTSQLRVMVSTSTLAWGAISLDTNIAIPFTDDASISELSEGSPILSVNESTGLIEEDEITHYLEMESWDTYEVELEDGRTLTVDYKHPFYIKGRGQIQAYALEEGMEVYLKEDIDGGVNKSLSGLKRLPIEESELI